MNQQTKAKIKKEAIEWLKAIAIAGIIVFLLFRFVVMPVTVDGISMYPTLNHQDRLITYRLFYTPKQGDIVILSENTGLNEALVKRVIALEGQTVDIDENGCFLIDGVLLTEDYISVPILDEYRGDWDYPIQVPEGKVFVVGDNRNGSHDSRYSDIGFIDVDEVLGKAVWRLLPLKDFGTLY